MGMLAGVEVYPGEEPYLTQILEKQILSPFQMGQLLSYSWTRYGFSGESRPLVMPLTSFSRASAES